MNSLSSVSPNFSFGGLASGLDTQAIIDALVQVESIPILRLQQKKSTLQLQDNFFQNITTKLDALKTAAQTLKDLNTVAGFSATSSDETVLSATVTGGANPGTYAINVTQLATRETHTSQNGFASRNQTIFSGPSNFSFDITTASGTQTINLQGNVTLEDVRDAINNSNASVTATIINTNTGSNPFELIVSADSQGTPGNFSFDFSASPAGLSTALALSETQNGLDALFTLNGIASQSSSNLVSDVLDGVTINLKSLGQATLELSSDPTLIQSKVQDFITKYNDVVTLLNAQSTVNGDGSTNAVLFGDSGLRSIRSRVRSAVTDVISNLTGSFTSLSSLGITSGTDGKLTLDETSFQNALATDSNAVRAVFITATDGVGDRLKTALDSLTDPASGLIKIRRDSITSRTKTIDNRIGSLQRRLDAFQERLVKKFASFEQLISSFQAQGAALRF